MEKKHKEDIAKAENEHEKAIGAMEKRQSREIDKLNDKLRKKDQKLAKLKEKKKGQASASATRRWDNYNKTYAKAGRGKLPAKF